MSKITRSPRPVQSGPRQESRNRSTEPAPIAADFRLPEPYSCHAAFPTDPDNERDRRIASVGPILVREANLFLRKMRPHERVHLELVDLIQEAWVVIMLRYDLYDPARGSFTTFAGLVLRQRFAELRNQARAVKISRDVVTAARTPGRHSEAGMAAIRRAMEPAGPIEPDRLVAGSPGVPDQAAHAETAELARGAVSRLVARLPRRAASIIGRYYGLRGKAAESPLRTGRRFGMSASKVTAARLKSEAALRSAPIDAMVSRALAACGL